MPRLVLLHGFTQTGAAWDGVRAQLGESYSATAPDLRGHGSSATAYPVTLDAAVTDVLEWLGDAGPHEGRFEASVLAGYSMGGRIALLAALSAPAGSIGRLVLVSGTAGIEDGPDRAARREADNALADGIEAEGVDAFSRRWGELPLFAGQSVEVRLLAERMRASQSAEGLTASLRGMGTGEMPAVWDRLAELAVPTVLVAGERDGKFCALARRMVDAIPDAEMRVVPGVGHAVHLEAPAAVAAAIAGRPI